MDILRNLFGSLTAGLIRLAVAVGVLAATYVFIVKPVLHTTDHAIESANRTFEKSFGAPPDLKDMGRTIEGVSRRVRIQVRRSLRSARRHGGGGPQRLVRCIQRSNGNVDRIQRCTRRF